MEELDPSAFTTLERAMIADEVPILRDPFEALICAAALSLGPPLLTRDQAIEESGVVRTIWEWASGARRASGVRRGLRLVL